MFIGHLNIIFGEVPVQVFSLLTCKVCLYILETNPLSDIYGTISSPAFVVPFHSLNSIF